MIKIKIYRNSFGRIWGYNVSGHYGKQGSSIVCAGISSLAQTALKGIGQHLHRQVDYKVMSGDLHMRLKDEPDDFTDAILETMLLGFYDIQEVVPQGVSISEVQEV